MKKVIKSKVFLVIITMILCISGTLYAANTYKATDVIYNSSDGSSMNVEDALNELYNISNTNGKLVKATNNKIPVGVTTAYVFISKMTTYNTDDESITGNIINSKKAIGYLRTEVTNVAVNVLYVYELSLSGNEGTISVSFSYSGKGTTNNNYSIYYLD